MTTLALALFSASALFLGALWFVGICLHWRDKNRRKAEGEGA